jgi:hypothetical protein
LRALKSDAVTNVTASTPRSIPPLDDGQDLRPSRSVFPSLSLMGFADAEYRVSDREGDRNTFALGQLDLYITSQLAEDVSVISENVVEAGEDNGFRFEPERLLLQYAPRDYFKAGIGRFHTALGYYNTAYHHSTWLQTATGRPYVFDFEDDGGPLPVHNVGLTFNGQIPSGRLNLHYTAEIGNGRDYNPGHEPVLNVQDNDDYKAVNLAVGMQPEWLPGLRAGVSFYHDRVSLEGPLPAAVDQMIFAAYAVYLKSPYEWLSEALLLRHKTKGGATHHTPAFYAQVARQFGQFRPYLRFEYLNAPEGDLLLQAVGSPGLFWGPSVGLRYDFTQYACIKAQYDHRELRHEPSFNQFTLQVGYVF